MISLTQNHFELFQLPERFALDARALDDAYRTVQAQVHPDRFAAAGEAQKRIAMQWAAHVNDAYQTLKSPLKRATYLLHLRGVDIDAENNTAMEPAFLMQQMMWRERAEEAAHANALDTLLQALRDEAAARLERLGALLDSDASQAQAAVQAVRQLMFIERVMHDVDARIEKLDIPFG